MCKRPRSALTGSPAPWEESPAEAFGGKRKRIGSNARNNDHSDSTSLSTWSTRRSSYRRKGPLLWLALAAFFLCGILFHQALLRAIGMLQQQQREDQRQPQSRTDVNGSCGGNCGQDSCQNANSKSEEEGRPKKRGRKRRALAKLLGFGKDKGEKGDKDGAKGKSKRKRKGRGGDKKSKTQGKAVSSLQQEHEELIAALREQVDAVPQLRERAAAAHDPFTDETLLRFLSVSYWKLDRKGTPLLQFMEETVQWRETFRPYHITADEVVEYGRSMHMYSNGVDLQGKPIVYLRMGAYDWASGNFNSEGSLRLLMFTLETAIRSMKDGVQKFAVVVDCTDFGLSMVPPLAYVKEVFAILMKNYPMRLGYVRIINAPGTMNFIWKVISKVLEERTKQKIDFIAKGQEAVELTKLIAAETLEERLGGKLPPEKYPTVESFFYPQK